MTSEKSPVSEPPPSTQPDQQTVAGWVAQFSNGVKFIAWTRVGDELTGTLSEAILPEGKTTAVTDSYGFTGTLEGSSVTLKLSGFLGGTVISGEVVDNELRLSMPASDGSLSVETYLPGTTADYNSGVQLLQAQVEAAQSAQQAAQQATSEAAASQAALRELESAVDNAGSQVSSDIGGISSFTDTLQGFLESANDELATETADFATLKSDYASLTSQMKSHAKGDPGICGGIYPEVWNDAGTVDTDVSTVSSYLDDSTPQGLSDLAAQIQQDANALEAAESQIPDYDSNNAASSSDINSALATIKSVLSDWKTKRSSYESQANSMDDTAKTILSKATSASGC